MNKNLMKEQLSHRSPPLITLLFMLLLVGLFYALLQTAPRKSAGISYPLAKNGVMDLRKWDFDKDGPVPLKGEWEFYWNTLLGPRQESSPEKTRKEVLYASVPGTWTSLEREGVKLPGTGFASYRLTLLLDNPPEDLAVQAKTAGTTLALFADGRLVMSAGVTGRSRESSQAAFRPATTESISKDSPGRIIIEAQVSNWEYRTGGLWRSFWLGDRPTLEEWRWNADSRSLILLSSLMMMAFYHFALFVMRPSDRFFLFLGLYCFLLAFRALFPVDYTISRYLPDLPFQWLIRIEYLTFFLAIPVAIYLFHAMYPAELRRWIPRATLIGSGLFSLVVLFTDTRFFTNLIYPFYLFITPVILYTLAAIFRAALHRRLGALFSLLGAIILAGATFNDILYASFVIRSRTYIQLALILFVFFQALALSRRLTHVLQKEEDLSKSLKELNENLEEMVEERSKKLQESYDEVKNLELIQAGEKERQHLGRTLHDSLGQSVHALELFTTSLLSREVSSESYHTSISRLNMIIGELKNSFYDMIHQLYPVSGGAFSLIDSVRNLALKTSDRYSVPVKIFCPNERIPCDENTAVNLYYLISEALLNSVKHAKPSRISIDLLYRNRNLDMIITNDGLNKKIAPKDDSEMESGNGMRIMNFRARSIGGTFRSEQEGEGTFIVSVHVPLKEEQYD
ncbi:MAG: hypothetical protein JEY99_04420 [Spirochaetales bacterium]|nr:hypothetical protein [Spirochaetales bacterium]